MHIQLAAVSTEIQKQSAAFAGSQGANFGAAQDPRVVVALVVNLLLGLVGTLFLVYMVYAGFVILTSRGEEDKISKAKSTIQTCIIGVLIILMAYGIVSFVTSSLLQIRDVPGTINFQFFGSTNDNGQLRYPNTDPLNPPNSSFAPGALNSGGSYGISF